MCKEIETNKFKKNYKYPKRFKKKIFCIIIIHAILLITRHSSFYNNSIHYVHNFFFFIFTPWLFIIIFTIIFMYFILFLYFSFPLMVGNDFLSRPFVNKNILYNNSYYNIFLYFSIILIGLIVY